MESSPSSSKEPTWEEFLPKSAWCVQNLLTDEECQQVVQLAKEDGILDREMQGDTRHRQRVNARLNQPALLQRMWDRIKDQIPQEIVITQDNFEDMKGLLCCPEQPEEFVGRWTPSGLIDTLNVAYCSGKGHLAAHRDSDAVKNEHERTFLTINGFLTARPAHSGGATRFLVDEIPVVGADIPIRDEHILHKVEPDQAGKAVVFFHGLMHDGEPLAEESPPKWIFRSLVYYRRDPETAPQMSPQAVEARAILKQAVEAEEAGQIGPAMQLYKKAYRLDPSLDV